MHRDSAIRVESISDFVDQVTGRAIAHALGALPGTNPLWFRGCSNIDYKLVPSLLREPYLSQGWSSGWSLEGSLLNRFINRAHAFATVPARIVDQLVLMQHFGMPTRILDWTESALAGLYFAVRDADEDADGCVWILLPHDLCEQALGRTEIPSSQVDLLESLATDKQSSLTEPVPFYPANLNARVTAQGGCFTFHPFEPYALERYAEARAVPLRVPGHCKRDMLGGLRTLGVTESTLFPDLDGLARDIRMLHERGA